MGFPNINSLQRNRILYYSCNYLLFAVGQLQLLQENTYINEAHFQHLEPKQQFTLAVAFIARSLDPHSTQASLEDERCCFECGNSVIGIVCCDRQSQLAKCFDRESSCNKAMYR